MALLLTWRATRQAKARSASCAGVGWRWLTSCQLCRVHIRLAAVDLLHQHAAGDAAQAERAQRRPVLDKQAQVLLLSEQRERFSVHRPAPRSPPGRGRQSAAAVSHIQGTVDGHDAAKRAHGIGCHRLVHRLQPVCRRWPARTGCHA